NSTPAATSGPARQPLPASSTPATSGTPSARSNANRRRPLVRRRARRRARAVDARGRLAARLTRSVAAISCAPIPRALPPSPLEDPDATEGPVGGKGLPDDPSGGDWSPKPAVVRFATVVAHHEPVSGRNLDRGREVAFGVTRDAGFDV